MEIYHGGYCPVETPGIIEGRNDQIYNYISDFISGVLTREQFWVLAKFKHPTHQINFCTPEALECLTFIKSEEVKV